MRFLNPFRNCHGLLYGPDEHGEVDFSQIQGEIREENKFFQMFASGQLKIFQVP